MIMILLGPPGSGKGTVAKYLHKEYSFSILSTGELLRKEMEKETELGQEVARFIENGELVADATMNKLIKKELQEVKDDTRLILDGYPRTLNQAHALDQLLQTDPLVFYFDLPKNILMDRLLDRGRADDTRDIINHRFEVYQEETEPLIHYYRQKDLLVQIQAQSSAAIFNKIEEYL